MHSCRFQAKLKNREYVIQKITDVVENDQVCFYNLLVYSHLALTCSLLQNPAKRARVDSGSDEDDESTAAKYKKALSRFIYAPP